jgi:hypothetical protein
MQPPYPGQPVQPQYPIQQAQFSPTQGGGWLEVKTEFFFMLWILFFVSTGIEVNGQRHRRPWGVTTLELPPGNHQVKIYFNYLFGPAGVSIRNVTVHPGHITRLRYSAPWLVFLSGSVTEMPPVPMAQLRV